jgi:hypothetical protein
MLTCKGKVLSLETDEEQALAYYWRALTLKTGEPENGQPGRCVPTQRDDG